MMSATLVPDGMERTDVPRVLLRVSAAVGFARDVTVPGFCIDGERHGLGFRSTDETLGGKGTRLGTAYKLSNGDIVYVPETPAAPGKDTKAPATKR